MRRGTKSHHLNPLERDEQASVVQWCRLKDKLRYITFKIENEGKRTPAQAAFAKAQGLLPGASDLFIAIPSSRYHGLFIEMKRRKGSKVTPEQVQFLHNVCANGYCGVAAYGCEHALQLISDYLSDKVVPCNV